MNDRMMSVISMIKAHPFISLFVAIALFISTAIIMRTSGSCLKTLHAPVGIISFELAFTKDLVEDIKSEWASTVCIYGTTIISVAKANTYQDFLFIPAYTFLLIVSIVLASTAKSQPTIPRVTLRLANLALVAAGCDVVENIFMLLYLNDNNIHPITFGIFAAVKFIVILYIIAFVLWSFIAKGFRGFSRHI